MADAPGLGFYVSRGMLFLRHYQRWASNPRKQQKSARQDLQISEERYKPKIGYTNIRKKGFKENTGNSMETAHPPPRPLVLWEP